MIRQTRGQPPEPPPPPSDAEFRAAVRRMLDACGSVEGAYHEGNVSIERIGPGPYFIVYRGRAQGRRRVAQDVRFFEAAKCALRLLGYE